MFADVAIMSCLHLLFIDFDILIRLPSPLIEIMYLQFPCLLELNIIVVKV